MNKIRSSLRRLASLRTLVTVACLTGLQVALKLVISIQVTQTVRISLDYLVHVAVSAMFGPAAGVLSGAAADLLGWLVHPTGPFNPGFTLSAITSHPGFERCFGRRADRKRRFYNGRLECEFMTFGLPAKKR